MRRVALVLLFVALAASGWAQTRIVTGDVFRLSSDGTAAAPAVTWASDPNTGLFRSTTDTLALTTGGAARLTIGPAGTVTIAAPTAAVALNVFGAASQWTSQVLGAAGSGVSFGQLVVAGTTSADVAFDVRDKTNTLYYLRVRGDGHVGLGTATPSTFTLQTAGSVGPNATHTYDLASDALRWRTLYANELNVWRLVAKSVISTIGGEVWTSPTTKLTAALTNSATSFTVNDNFLVSGDYVILKDLTNIEVIRVDSSYGGGAGAYTYTISRNYDGTGANTWALGVPVVSTGNASTGTGFITQYADDNPVADVFGGAAPLGSTLHGPTMLGLIRTGSTWNNIAPRWAIGNLYGLYDHGTNTRYGFCTGNYSATWMCLDDTNGFRIMYQTTPKVTIEADGDATFAGVVTATGGTFGGYTLTSNNLYRGTGSTTAGIYSGDTTAFYAGSATPGSAPFRVLTNGAMFAGISYFGSTTGMDVDLDDAEGGVILRGVTDDPSYERFNISWGPGSDEGVRLTHAGPYASGENFVIEGTAMTEFLVRVAISDTPTYTEYGFKNGMVVGSPTGGYQGNGTINVASGFYVNGDAFTEFPGASGTALNCSASGGVATITVDGEGLYTGGTCMTTSPLVELASLRALVFDLQARLAALEGSKR